MSLWTHIKCKYSPTSSAGTCGRLVRFDQDTLVAAPHRMYMSILRDRQCPLAGKPIDPSQLPGWHPKHVCGKFCDGVDDNGQIFMFSTCRDERQRGPPSAVDALADIAGG